MSEPFEELREELDGPWYTRILPESRLLRLLLLAGLIVGGKALFTAGSGKKRGSKTKAQTVEKPAAAIPLPPVPGASAFTGSWFYFSDGREFGPFDAAAMAQMIRAGVLAPATPVRSAEGGDWISADQAFPL